MSAPRATRRLADIVHEQLDRLIARGEFPKGCKLPPEGELATRFGVSRPVIRDALSRLKDAGYVRSQRGSGTIVVRGEAPGKHAYPPIRTVADLLRSYEFRITVETATAAMAAERRAPSDLADLDRTLDRAARARDAPTPPLLADL
ncbi:MAG: FadR/GntR family transcriptional regulator, partial [Vicinamibacteria bacterium]